MELVNELAKITTDDSPLGQLFAAKKDEIATKIELLEAIGEEDFTLLSGKLYGLPTTSEVANCRKVLKEMPKKTISRNLLSFEEIKTRFEQIFKNYSLNDWKVIIRKSMITNCSVGKKANSTFATMQK